MGLFFGEIAIFRRAKRLGSKPLGLVLFIIPLLPILAFVITITRNLFVSETVFQTIVLITYLVLLFLFVFLKRAVLPSYSRFNLITNLTALALLTLLNGFQFPVPLAKFFFALFIIAVLIVELKMGIVPRYLMFLLSSSVLGLSLLLPAAWLALELIAGATPTLEKLFVIGFASAFSPAFLLSGIYIFIFLKKEKESISTYIRRVKQEEEFIRSHLLENRFTSPWEYTFLVLSFLILSAAYLLFHWDPFLNASLFLTAAALMRTTPLISQTNQTAVSLKA